MRYLIITVGAALLALTAACGGVSASAPPVSSKPSTPQVCIEALDKAELTIGHARDGFGLMSEMADASSDGFTAVAKGYGGGLDDANARIEVVNGKLADLNPKVVAAVQAYNEAASRCRATAQ